MMEQPYAQRVAARYGLRVGVILAVAGCADVGLQALCHTIGPSAHGLIILTYVLLAAAIVLFVLAGFLAARSTGRLEHSIISPTLIFGAMTSRQCKTCLQRCGKAQQ